jgi:serine/threonine-protein kinase
VAKLFLVPRWFRDRRRPPRADGASRSASDARVPEDAAPAFGATASALPTRPSTPSAPAVERRAAWLEPNTRIGPYRVVREIGRGGMGTVFLAERADGGFAQTVALKIMRLGVGTGVADDEELVGRFLQERQILARLEHPNVARLIDGGFTPDGRPYFAMEYVEGEPITAYCDRLQLDIDARLELFEGVCDAVLYAHQHLIVHRDLKPSNTLVAASGRVKLLDFGIAKLLDEAPVASFTRVGGSALTPAYAAPEQIRGERVTTATDVYALGAMLYELLTGRRSLEVPSGGTTLELERAICERDPEPPSAAASSDRLARRLRGDLDTIVLRALEKEASRRYPSVDALLEDLRRHRGGLPILARPAGTAYRVRKFVSRHRVAVAAGVLVMLSLVAGLVGTAWQARVASREAAKAREISRFLTGTFEVADPARANPADITARELLDRGAARIDAELAANPDVQASMMALLGRLYRQLGVYPKAQPLLERAVALQRSMYGERSAEVAATLAELAGLSQDQGRPEEAVRLHQEALAIRREVLGPTHPDVGTSLRDLATVLRTAGKHERAEALQREALVIHRNHYGPAHSEVASDLTGLGSILRERGQLAAAVTTLRQALELSTRLLGTDHLETNTVMNNLAIALTNSGEFAEAERLYRQVLAFDQRRLGEQHPNTATVRNNLASVLRDRGEHAEAERLYRAVLDYDRRELGPRHPYTATVLYNLGTVLHLQGRHGEAERCFDEALLVFREVYGNEHWRVHSVNGGLAMVRHAQGQPAAASRLFRQAIAGLERALAPGHQQIEPVLLAYGRLLVEQGNAAEAERLFARVVASRTARVGEADRRTAEARAWLEAARAGDPAKAVAMLSRGR